MSAVLEDVRIDVVDAGFAGEIDDLRARLGAPDNPLLFPAHFLKAAFPKIGGQLVRISTPQGLWAVGFLFARALADRRRHYTLRLHRVPGNSDSGPALTPSAIAAAVAQRIDADVTPYDPSGPTTYRPATATGHGLEIVEPSAQDTDAIRALQRRIWSGAPDGLYPPDLHSEEFHAGTSLVAKLDGVLAGFLFGFFKFGGPALPARLAAQYPGELRLESQLMAVEPGHGGAGIGKALKLRQAALARREGIQLVNWTFDPLQFVNASLNLRRLGAVAFHFYRNYYQVANALNHTPASRLSVTWFIDTQAVHDPAPRTGRALDLAQRPDIVRVNHGVTKTHAPGGARAIAIEIPRDWTAMQQDPQQRDAALQWRTTTDEILDEYLGPEDGRYALTDVGEDGDQRYLIGERVDDELMRRLET